MPDASLFKIVEEPIPEPADGQFVVKNVYLSLDPAMRGWMNDVKSYIAPVKLGDVMRGQTVGQVIASKNPKFRVGDLVSGIGGWQKYAVADGKRGGWEKLVPGFAPTLFLGVLGGTGITAYFGLLRVGLPKAGETVLVSGAAGAVGSVVGQIAKIKGCRVVGIAGSDEKCKWLVDELGFDAVVNYKGKSADQLNDEIRQACPKGVDVFFDNVGGDILDVALKRIRKGARIVICGAISQYNAAQTKGPANYLSLLVHSARMEGFVLFDYIPEYPLAIRELGQWVKEGKLKYAEEVVEGLERAPEYLNMLFTGANKGKLIVKLADEPAQFAQARL